MLFLLLGILLDFAIFTALGCVLIRYIFGGRFSGRPVGFAGDVCTHRFV